ncbi:N-acetyl-gamma-glutamyl-phosphate reductase [Pikeienuella piscinae]|uniref:N-acetyl-gamma-glutamyl-phosphate reductase n=1 Tax=Pikeienuella piscinae TaxID=2748098 RepID=A0A7L5BV30_9RHOB|nr:N-acetyl-gamma-glutamyl-phosphate reductase [Pikeienuella piscinae]QIE54923.1 N-acetyl-gamma-glutamyl-phosphate reductase [Pikeienuella piscinae]
MTTTHKTAILGASGYTGAELVRLIHTHPAFEISAMTADRKAGQAMGAVFPHLAHLELPVLSRMEEVDWTGIDLAFCAMPHATAQQAVIKVPERVRIVDLSADFRLRDIDAYAKWYGHEHLAPELQKIAVYGAPEFYREEMRTARLIAGTGCFAISALLPLVPLLEAGVIDPDHIIIDSKTGITGAGRAPSERKLFSEVTEGVDAYNIAKHRHTAEFDQELSKAAGRAVVASFTPHLLPMNRGILATIYVHGEADAAHEALARRYADEPFVDVLPLGAPAPETRHVRGSNLARIGVTADRQKGRTIIVSALDNLVKGASGQAIQCANIALGLPETMGLEAAPLFP